MCFLIELGQRYIIPYMNESKIQMLEVYIIIKI